MTFTLFTDPPILQQIGPRRLSLFFNRFENDLKPPGLELLLNLGRQYGLDQPIVDIPALAATLAATDRLPDRLRNTLFSLEAAASLDNQIRLDSLIQQRIPQVGLAGYCPLDRALELWFHFPAELTQFTSNGAPAAAEPSSILHPPSSSSATPISDPSYPSAKSESSPSTLTSQPSTTSEAGENPTFRPIEPWPEPVVGHVLLDFIVAFLTRFVVLPKWAAETLALWIVHTYAFRLRDVTTYIGIESPEHRCGKTTLVTLLSDLVYHAVVSSNITASAFFHVIGDLQPTLFIDEADTFLPGNEQLQGILNSGYTKKTAFVWRMTTQATKGGPDLPNSQPSTLNPQLLPQPTRFSSWCPKLISRIGRLPVTLADRCILIRMQRKLPNEQCERIKDLDTLPIQRQCVRFVADHAAAIASARPEIPKGLNDRAADIWEPLLALADLAGGHLPELARKAALGLSVSEQDSNPIGSLLVDIFGLFIEHKTDRLFTRTLVASLNTFTDRPWMEIRNGKEITDLWLSKQLRPYGIKPKTIRIGESQAKGYLLEECMEVFKRYISRSELEASLPDAKPPDPPPPSP
jgi:hypothetical protein